MGIPLPEDGQPLRHWQVRRLIRNLVWMVGGLTIVYLLGLSLHQSRENGTLYRQLERQADAQVTSLAEILVRVKGAEDAAHRAGVDAAVTFQQAVDALKAAFPAGTVDAAIQKAARTTTTRPAPTTASTARQVAPTTSMTGGQSITPSTTTTTARQAPTPTTTPPPTTTTTIRPCAVGLSVPGLARLCLIGE